MGGFYSHPFFANLYEIFKNFSYYISKVGSVKNNAQNSLQALAE